MKRFDFQVSEDCPNGEYVLRADPRFRVEPIDGGGYRVVEVTLPGEPFFKMQHHGRHSDLQSAMDEASARGLPIARRGSGSGRKGKGG